MKVEIAMRRLTTFTIALPDSSCKRNRYVFGWSKEYFPSMYSTSLESSDGINPKVNMLSFIAFMKSITLLGMNDPNKGSTIISCSWFIIPKDELDEPDDINAVSRFKAIPKSKAAAAIALIAAAERERGETKQDFLSTEVEKPDPHLNQKSAEVGDPPNQAQSSSGTHFDDHPSPFSVFPSSQTSPTILLPSPQMTVQAGGVVL